MGFVPALVALYQLVTFTGAQSPIWHVRTPGQRRDVLCTRCDRLALAYLDDGRRRLDAVLTAFFAAALIATYSIDGLITLAVMLIALGLLRPGSSRGKLGPCAVAGVVVLVFFATPLGSDRIAKESTTNIETTGEPNSSLGWRLHKWKTLIPVWEKSPIFGQGLGTTTTGEGPPANPYVRKPPHNEYIRYMVETGVVGLVILLAALALPDPRSPPQAKNPRHAGCGHPQRATLALVVVLGCLVNSLADNTLLVSPTCYAAALIVAAVLAYPSTEVRRAPALRAA